MGQTDQSSNLDAVAANMHSLPGGGGGIQDPEVIAFARCPVHGLHGQRDYCYVCLAECEQPGFISVEDYQALQAQLEAELETSARLRVQIKRQIAEIRDLRYG